MRKCLEIKHTHIIGVFLHDLCQLNKSHLFNASPGVSVYLYLEEGLL